jgi:hypothetical protein
MQQNETNFGQMSWSNTKKADSQEKIFVPRTTVSEDLDFVEIEAGGALAEAI